MNAGRTLAGPPGSEKPFGAIRFSSLLLIMLVCAGAANVLSVRSALADQACVKLGSSAADMAARRQLDVRKDPCAKEYWTKWAIAHSYDRNFLEYEEARRWYQSALAQLLNGSATDVDGPKESWGGLIEAVRGRLKEITPDTPEDSAQKRGAFNKKFEASIKDRKDVGDFVCAPSFTMCGYVESVHNDKIQIRIRHLHAIGANEPDELRWVKFDAVGNAED